MSARPQDDIKSIVTQSPSQSDVILKDISLKDYMEKIAYTAFLYGFVPIPLKNKIPVVKGWTDLRNDPDEDIVEILKGNYPINVRRVGNLIEYKGANNVGVVTGEASGVVVIDIDTEKNGIETWNQLIEANSPIPKTFTVKTASGGLHYYFNYTDDLKNVGNINRLYRYPIDYRTNAGMVVFPGSIDYKRNKQYMVIDGYEPYPKDPRVQQMVITDMPIWLKNLIVMDRIIKEDKMPVTTDRIRNKADRLGIRLS